MFGVPSEGSTVAVIEIAIAGMINTEADMGTVLIDTDIGFDVTAVIEIQLVSIGHCFYIHICGFGNILGGAQIPGLRILGDVAIEVQRRVFVHAKLESSAGGGRSDHAQTIAVIGTSVVITIIIVVATIAAATIAAATGTGVAGNAGMIGGGGDIFGDILAENQPCQFRIVDEHVTVALDIFNLVVAAHFPGVHGIEGTPLQQGFQTFDDFLAVIFFIAGTKNGVGGVLKQVGLFPTAPDI